jgi:hypothetical protein
VEPASRRIAHRQLEYFLSRTGRSIRNTAARRVLSLALLVCTFLGVAPGAALAAGETSSTSQHARADATMPDVTALFGQAVSRVHRKNPPRFSRAKILEADGTTRKNRPVKYASGITSWRFVLDNQASKSKYQSVTLTYGPAPAKFGPIVGHTEPFMEDVVIPKAPKMTVKTALALLRKAGHYRNFTDVTLRNPLGPDHGHPLYIFTMKNGSYYGVDTVTGKVNNAG